MRQIPAFRAGVVWCALAMSLIVIALCARPASAGQQAAAALKIVVIEGEDSVNLIDKKTAVKPTVEVRDKNDLPVAGASVRFAINGSSAAFQGGSRSVTVTTDSLGRATVNSITPTSKGAVQIQVQASYQGQNATATISQTNFANAADAAQAGKVPSQASSGGGSSAGGSAAAGGGAAAGGLSTLAIAGIAGGAAAGVGAAVAVSRSGSDSGTTTTPQNNVNLTGTWNGTISGAHSNGNVVLRLTQNGNAITGQDVTPNPALGSIPSGTSFSFTTNITGTVNGTAVTLTYVGTSSGSSSVPGLTFTYTCTYNVPMTLTAANSNSMSGTWTETGSCAGTPAGLAPPITINDSGRIALTKQ